MRNLIVLFIVIMVSGCQNARPSSSVEINSKDTLSIRVGQKIDDASAIMAPLGDGSPLLSMETDDPDYSIKMWPTNDGVIIAVYSNSRSTITSLDFHLSDERPKGTRKTFEFEISSFEPSTGIMTLIVPSKAMNQND